MSRVACVVPTIRDMKPFMKAWQPLFDKHQIEFITVYDGKNPRVEHIEATDNYNKQGEIGVWDTRQIMGKYVDCLSNFNGGIRNLGFAYVAKYMPEIEYVITLDDDVRPIGDPIQDHIDALNMKVPISWMSTASEYMRGFPYEVREEAQVMLSHGVWEGVADWDAATQLVQGNHPVEFPKMPIPKGILFPCCAMNLAFRREMLPFIYQAPQALDMRIGRMDDILAGITAKREIDKQGWAAVTGYARVHHERASDVYKNLELEANGYKMYEQFWQGDESHPYFAVYKEKLALWQTYLKNL